MPFKPRLLKETAEIALTEIKRYVEPRLMDALSLRRVSAPLFLPADSPLLCKEAPGVRISLPGLSGEVEIVGSLDTWLRGQLSLYDIAPGFGVFTIMNALRPDLPSNSISSPHVAAWAWQQAREETEANAEAITLTAHKLYEILLECEKMILERFPHLDATLPAAIEVVDAAELNRRAPGNAFHRQVYEYMHPDDDSDKAQKASSGHHKGVFFLVDGSPRQKARGELWVWNRILRRPVRLFDLAAWLPDRVCEASIGGNIFRDFLALQILHQDRLLSE